MAIIAERPVRTGRKHGLRAFREEDPGGQAFILLHAAYVAAPLIAGIDKFFSVLASWGDYLAPAVPRLTGIPTESFMRMVGVVEIAAAFLVAVVPRWGAPVVGLWLLGIVVNLLMVPGYYDVALRDFGLALGAFALWRLCLARGE